MTLVRLAWETDFLPLLLLFVLFHQLLSHQCGPGHLMEQEWSLVGDMLEGFVCGYF